MPVKGLCIMRGLRRCCLYARARSTAIHHQPQVLTGRNKGLVARRLGHDKRGDKQIRRDACAGLRGMRFNLRKGGTLGRNGFERIIRKRFETESFGSVFKTQAEHVVCVGPGFFDGLERIRIGFFQPLGHGFIIAGQGIEGFGGNAVL